MLPRVIASTAMALCVLCQGAAYGVEPGPWEMRPSLGPEVPKPPPKPKPKPKPVEAPAVQDGAGIGEARVEAGALAPGSGPAPAAGTASGIPGPAPGPTPEQEPALTRATADITSLRAENARLRTERENADEILHAAETRNEALIRKQRESTLATGGGLVVLGVLIGYVLGRVGGRRRRGGFS